MQSKTKLNDHARKKQRIFFDEEIRLFNRGNP
jgi:hypothetical protein